MKKLLFFLFSFSFSVFIYGQSKSILLPSPDTTGGNPLMSVLKERASVREFSTQKLSIQQLSDLCWAAFGINRSESGKRTAPSAMNRQETDLYLAMDSGIYKYDAQHHSLNLIKRGDYRKSMAKQDFVSVAPVCIIYVADLSKMNGSDERENEKYSFVNVGFISQNVYLYCASNNLATVILGYIDRSTIASTLELNKNQKVLFSQPVGLKKTENK